MLVGTVAVGHMGSIREEDSTRLRASLRGLLPALVTLVLFVLGLGLLSQIFESVTEKASSSEVLLALVAQILLYVILIGVAVWGARRLEHQEYTDFGLNVDVGWVQDFAVGTAISLLGITMSLWWADVREFRSIDLAAGGITGPEEPLVLGVVLAVFVCYFLLGNIYEEVVYRRIVLGNFVEGLTARGFSPAVVVVPATATSLLLFGMFHIPLRGNLVVAIDAALVGIPFALAYLLTGELGLPIGIHFGRLPIEFIRGMTIGEFEVVPIVEITQNTLPANLELKFVRLGLISLFVLAWVYLNHGEIRLAKAICQRNGD